MLTKIRFLIIEDLSSDVELIERELRTLGQPYEIRTVQDEASLRHGLEAFKPDMVLSDYMLPRFTGMEALKIVQGFAPDLPFIIVTGSMNELVAVECMKAGAWDYVIKEKLSKLVPAIHSALEKRALIKENRAAQQALQASERRFRTLIETAPVAIVAYTSDGKIHYGNDLAVKLIGAKDLAEVLGRSVLDFIHPDYQELVKQRVAKTLTGETLGPAEEKAFKLDGKEICLEVSSRAMTINGKPGIVAVLNDVTARKQAEERLRLQSAALEAAANAIVITNQNGTIQWTNPAFTRLTGYSVEDAIGQNPRILKSGEHSPGFYKQLWQTILSGEVWQGELINKRKDGSLYTEEMTITPVRNTQGKITHFIAIKQDITARKRAEEEMSSLLRFQNEMLDTAAVWINTLDTEGNVTFWNRAAENISGYSREEVLGHAKIWEWLYPDPAYRNGIFSTALEIIRHGKKVENSETTIRHKNGEYRVISWHANNLVDSEGRAVGSIAIGADVSKRKEAEAERERLLAQIHNQAQQMQQTLDTVPDGVMLLDTEHRVALANPVALNNLAVLADSKEGEVLTHLGDRSLPELLAAPPKGLWHEVMAEGRTFEVIARAIGDSSQPQGWVIVIRDVTRAREVQQRLQQQERLAAVGQLAAGIAHDFNNILAVIVLYTQMELNNPALPPKTHKRLETTAQQANLASELIRQILDFSRRAVLERRPMDLKPFLKEQVKLLERTLPENIKIKLDYGHDEYTVNADPTRMQQILLNLAVNARDALPSGGKLRISLERIRVTDSTHAPLPEMVAGEWVRISVADTGMGIPPEVLPHIFEPFFTTKRPGKGSGLGLAQVYGIVKQHGGHVDVTSQLNEGTTFTLYLPALISPKVQQPSIALEGVPQGRGETILAVEDNAILREALVDNLRLLHYHVIEAANGREALSNLEQHPEVDLVLSDLVMPEMGGLALFEVLKQHSPTLPVVILSGHPLEDELENLQAQSLAGWLLKPTDIAQLAQLLARVLR